MKIELNLDFKIPIWRFFKNNPPYKIPRKLKFNNKEYNNFICIIQIGHCVTENTFKYKKSYFKDILLHYGSNHIICAPNVKIFYLFKKYRPKLNICLANHNAFIDETFYTIDYSQKVINDLFVSSQFLKCKNLNLLHNINNICGVGYYPGSGTIVPFPSTVKKILNFKNNVSRIKKNWEWVEPKENVKEINSSKIGGIFSTAEGACFSSSEYLLCGIPVLSCKCQGGREIWYNKIIVNYVIQTIHQ